MPQMYLDSVYLSPGMMEIVIKGMNEPNDHGLRSSSQSFSKNTSNQNATKSHHSSILNPEIRPESRNSSLRVNPNLQNQTRNSHESKSSHRSILSTIQNVFRNSRENRSREEVNRTRLEDPNDIYCFRYSSMENDEDVYMFPKIPERSAVTIFNNGH
ncbi:358_t:CDS:2 [Acaulospora colombiana]|uniref:358_t:CDS:1 n=1 Tax=Acaulospora colombiana TaxID=27376 RepID=A0ACA9L0H0_9GLOM|nr:358_t:CDS:2 [Acaulospora colombiana]